MENTNEPAEEHGETRTRRLPETSAPKAVHFHAAEALTWDMINKQGTGDMYTTHDACSFPSINMDNKEKKRRLHAFKDRLTLSASKCPRRSGSPVPPDLSSDRDQQHSWSWTKFRGKLASAPTIRPTLPLPPTSSDNLIPKNPLSTYPIVS